MVVRAYGHVYLFEFKVAEMAPPGSALAQLKERQYADKYRGQGKPQSTWSGWSSAVKRATSPRSRQPTPDRRGDTDRSRR